MTQLVGYFHNAGTTPLASEIIVKINFLKMEHFV